MAAKKKQREAEEKAARNKTSKAEESEQVKSEAGECSLGPLKYTRIFIFLTVHKTV